MNADDPRVPRSDRDADDVHTTASEQVVDPGIGRSLLATYKDTLDELVATIALVPDTLVRAQLSQALMQRFRPGRDAALRTLVLTYEKPARQVAKDVSCSVSDVMMACAAKT